MIKQIHQNLIDKKISARELAEEYLGRIEEKDKELNSFITVTKYQALKQAEQVDKDIADEKQISLLAGIPASIKDSILVQDIKTTAGSKMLENYVAPYDATLVEKLKQHGMVMLGKTNCDEFTCGSSNEKSAFDITKNPHDLTRVPGGSSGGSAASVTADLSVYSIGTDTGGSVRQPASFCGVVGFKPTYGSISRYGLIANASSLDQAGILAKSVEDVECVFNAIAGKDSKDSTTIKEIKRLRDKEIKNDLKGIKIGVPKEYFVAGMDKEVEQSVKDTIDKLEKMGAEIVEVNLPHTDYALAVYYIIQPAELSSNLARFDGIRYGSAFVPKGTTADKEDLIDIYKKTRAKNFGDEIKRRIMLGTYTLSAGYYDAYYKKAQQVRTLIRQDFDKVFNSNGVDLLITPVTPTPAFKIGEKDNDPMSMYLSDVFTVPISVAGLPAISIPCGKTKSNLPIGAQLVGPWQGESKIFEVGKVLEQVLDVK